MNLRKIFRLGRPLILAMIALAGPLPAQAVTAADVHAAAPVCWRARPLDRCRTWIVTEGAFEQPLFSTSAIHAVGNGFSYASDDFGGRLAFTVGAMFNRSAYRALGVTATMSMDDPDAIVPSRIEARYRQWIGPSNGLDLSLGLSRRTVRGDDELESVHSIGVTAGAGVTTTYFGIDGRVDLLSGNGRPVTGVFLGVRSGSRAAPIVTASGFVAFLAAFALMTGPNY